MKFREEREAKGELTGPDDPANFCLMMLVGMSDPGLIIQPTHRLVRGFVGLTSEALAARLAPEFIITPTGEGAAGCRDAWDTIQIGDEQDTLGFGTSADDRWFVAKLRNTSRMDKLTPDKSPEWRSLGVSILHELVLKDLLVKVGAASCTYVHQIGEVLDSVAKESCDIACLVPPAAMIHVEAIASNLEKMPPKSTYFYPKLLSGLVLNPLQ